MEENGNSAKHVIEHARAYAAQQLPGSLRAGRALGAAAIALAALGCFGASATIAHDLNSRLYPQPVQPKHGGWSLSFPAGYKFMCPDPRGLQQVSKMSSAMRDGAIKTVEGVTDSKTPGRAEMFADRAGWPLIETMYKTGSHRTQTRHFEIRLAANFPIYSNEYQRACGTTVITASLVVNPRGRTADLTPYYYILRRDDHWLFWGFQGG